MTRRRFFAALVGLAATAAGAVPGDQARLDYRLTAPNREVRGTSRELDWDVVALADGAFAFRVLVPADSLVSDDPAFDAALRKATSSQSRSFVAIRGIARRDRFEGKMLVGEIERKISLPVSTSHADGFLSATVTADVDPSLCGIPGFGAGTKLSVTFRVPASGNAVLAGGSSRAVN